MVRTSTRNVGNMRTNALSISADGRVGGVLEEKAERRRMMLGGEEEKRSNNTSSSRRRRRRSWLFRNWVSKPETVGESGQGSVRLLQKRRRRRIVKAEFSSECLLPRPAPDCHLRPTERIHVAFVSAMWHREPITEQETNQMIKSVIAQTKCKLWLHFLVAGLPEVQVIPKMLESLGAYQMIPNPPEFTMPKDYIFPVPYLPYVNKTYPDNAAVLFSLHRIPMLWVERQAKRLGLYPLTHHAGIPGMCKFFIADILWQVQRVIFLDVDTLFGGDIQSLWSYTRHVMEKRRLLYYMSNDNPELRGGASIRPWCSCQMVLSLKKMRKRKMTRLVVTLLRGRNPRKLKGFSDDGDQWLFTFICKNFPGFCRILPRMWNVSGCSKPYPFLGLTGRGKVVNGTCWRVVHFNCLAHFASEGGNYEVPKGWRQPFNWAKSLEPKDLRQLNDSRQWNAI